MPKRKRNPGSPGNPGIGAEAVANAERLNKEGATVQEREEACGVITGRG